MPEIHDLNLNSSKDFIKLSDHEQDLTQSNVIGNSALKGAIKRYDRSGQPFARPPIPSLKESVPEYEPENAFQQQGGGGPSLQESGPDNENIWDNSWQNENAAPPSNQNGAYDEQTPIPSGPAFPNLYGDNQTDDLDEEESPTGSSNQSATTGDSIGISNPLDGKAYDDRHVGANSLNSAGNADGGNELLDEPQSVTSSQAPDKSERASRIKPAQPKPVEIDPKADFKFRAVKNFALKTRSNFAQRRGMDELPEKSSVVVRANWKSSLNRVSTTDQLRKRGYQDNSPLARMNVNVLPKDLCRTFFRDRMRARNFISPEDENKYRNLTVKEQMKLRLADMNNAVGASSKSERGHFALTMARLKAQQVSLKEHQNGRVDVKQQFEEEHPLGIGRSYDKRYVNDNQTGPNVLTEAGTGRKYMLKPTARAYQEEMAKVVNDSQARKDELHLMTDDGIKAGKKQLAWFLDPKNDPDKRFQDPAEREQIIQDFESWCHDYNAEVQKRIDQRADRRDVMSSNVFQELGMPLETPGGKRMELRGEMAMKEYLSAVDKPTWKQRIANNLKNAAAALVTIGTVGIGLAIPWVRRRLSGQYAVDEMKQAVQEATSLNNPDVLADLKRWNKANAREWVAKEYQHSLGDKADHHQSPIHDPHGLFAAFGNYTKEELVANIKSQLKLSEAAVGDATNDEYLDTLAEGIFEGMAEGLYDAAEQQIEARAISQATSDADGWVNLNNMLLRHSCETAWQEAENAVDFKSTWSSPRQFENRMNGLERHAQNLQKELGRYQDGVIKSDASLGDSEEAEQLQTGLDKDIYLDKNGPRLKSVRENLSVAQNELSAARKSGLLAIEILGNPARSDSLKGIQQELQDDVLDMGLRSSKSPDEAKERANSQLQRVQVLREKLEAGKDVLTRADPGKLKYGFESPRQYDKLSQALDDLEERIRIHRDWRLAQFELEDAVSRARTPEEFDKLERRAADITQHTDLELTENDTHDVAANDFVSQGLISSWHRTQDRIKSARKLMETFETCHKGADDLMQQVRSNKLPVTKALAQFDRLMNHAEDQLRGEYDYFGNDAGRFQPEINALRARRAQLFSTGVGITNPGDVSKSTIDKFNTLHASGVLTDQFAQALRDEVTFRAREDSNQAPSAKHLNAALSDLDLSPVRTLKNPVKLPDFADLERLVAELDGVFEDPSSQNKPPQALGSTSPLANQFDSTNPFAADNDVQQQNVDQQPQPALTEHDRQRLANRKEEVNGKVANVMRFAARLYPAQPHAQFRLSQDLLRTAGLDAEELEAFAQTHHSVQVKTELHNAMANPDLEKALQNVGIEAPGDNLEKFIDSIEALAAKYQTYFARVGGDDIMSAVSDLRALIKDEQPLTEQQIKRARSLALRLSTLNPDVETNTQIRVAQDQKRVTTLQDRIAGDFGVKRSNAMQNAATMKEAADKAIVDQHNAAALDSIDDKVNGLKSLVTVQQESAAVVEAAVLQPLREFGQHLHKDIKDPKNATADEIRTVMESPKFRKKARVLGQVAGLFDAAETVKRKQLKLDTSSDVYASKLRAMNELADRLYQFDAKNIKAGGFKWWNGFLREMYQEAPQDVLKDLEAKGGKKMADDFVNVWKHLSMLNAMSRSKQDIEQGLAALAEKRNELLSGIQQHRSSQLVTMAILQEFTQSGQPLDQFKMDDAAVANIQKRLESWGHKGAWDTFVQKNPDVLKGLTEDMLYDWEAGAGALPEDLRKELDDFDSQLGAFEQLIREAARTSQSLQGTAVDPKQIQTGSLDDEAQKLEKNLQVVQNSFAARTLPGVLHENASWHQHKDWKEAGGATQSDMSTMSLGQFTHHLGEQLQKLAPSNDAKRRARADGLRNTLAAVQNFEQKVRIVKELILCGIPPASETVQELEKMADDLRQQAGSIRPGLVAQARLKKAGSTDKKDVLDLMANRLSTDVPSYVNEQMELMKSWGMNYL